MTEPIVISEPSLFTDNYRQQYLFYQGNIWHLTFRKTVFQELVAFLKPYFQLIPSLPKVFIIENKKYIGVQMEYKNSFRFFSAIPLTCFFPSIDSLNDGLLNQIRSWIFFYYLIKQKFTLDNFHITQYDGKLHILGLNENEPYRKRIQYRKGWLINGNNLSDEVPGKIAYGPEYEEQNDEERSIDNHDPNYMIIDAHTEVRKIIGQLNSSRLLEWRNKIQTAIRLIHPPERISAVELIDCLYELIDFSDQDVNHPLVIREIPELAEIDKGPEKVKTYYIGKSKIRWINWYNEDKLWSFSEEGKILSEGKEIKPSIYVSGGGMTKHPFIICNRKKIRVDKLIWHLFWGYSSFPKSFNIRPDDGNPENLALDNLEVTRAGKKPSSIAVVRVDINKNKRRVFVSKSQASKETKGISTHEITKLIETGETKNGYRWEKYEEL